MDIQDKGNRQIRQFVRPETPEYFTWIYRMDRIEGTKQQIQISHEGTKARRMRGHMEIPTGYTGLGNFSTTSTRIPGGFETRPYRLQIITTPFFFKNNDKWYRSWNPSISYRRDAIYRVYRHIYFRQVFQITMIPWIWFDITTNSSNFTNGKCSGIWHQNFGTIGLTGDAMDRISTDAINRVSTI